MQTKIGCLLTPHPSSPSISQFTIARKGLQQADFEGALLAIETLVAPRYEGKAETDLVTAYRVAHLDAFEPRDVRHIHSFHIDARTGKVGPSLRPAVLRPDSLDGECYL